MAPLLSRLACAIGFLLTLTTPAIASPYALHNNIARQDTLPCIPPSLSGIVTSGNGGRKIGLVIDASGSMSSNDPSDLRLTASKALSDALISQGEATNGKAADLLTVVSFSSSASVLYPLGDPTGANAVIDTITPGGGTYIGTGLKAAIDELTKPGNDPTADRTGIIIFTDGESSDPAETVAELQRAIGLGIRVSFGFLSVSTSSQDPEILRNILNSGGVYSLIASPTTQQTFVALVLANGMTKQDGSGSNVTSTLIPSLATAGQLTQTSSSTFTYGARAGETFNVTVTAYDSFSLSVTLTDSSTQAVLNTSNSDASGVAVVEYTAQSAMNIAVSVAATSALTTGGLFSVGLLSSIPVSDQCNLVVNNSPNSSYTPPSNYTPTGIPPAQYTGGASSLVNLASASTFSGFVAIAVAAFL